MASKSRVKCGVLLATHSSCVVLCIASTITVVTARWNFDRGSVQSQLEMESF
jgi:hypothetical protein